MSLVDTLGPVVIFRLAFCRIIQAFPLRHTEIFYRYSLGRYYTHTQRLKQIERFEEILLSG